jgi:serine/threonine protein kinase
LTSQKKDLLPELIDVLPNFTDAVKAQTQLKQSGQTLPEKDITTQKNIEILGKTIKEGNKPFGKGSYGSVFKIDGFSYRHFNQKETLAVKEIIFGNDQNIRVCKEEQRILMTDIKTNQDIANYDPERLYFSTIYDVYDMTDYLAYVYKNSDKKEGIEQYLQPTDDGSVNVAGLIMEFLDVEVYDYLRKIKYGEVHSFLHTRLRFMLNVGNGLLKIVSKYTHCDLKPHNLMFKKISMEESNDLRSKGVYPLQLYPGEYFQLKIIDFGLVAVGDEGTRKCSGGTPNFTPMEYFDDSLKDDKFDLFSLGMIMVDYELYEVGLKDFSVFNGEYHSMVKKDIYEFTVEKIVQLRQYPFYLKISQFWRSEKYNALLLEVMDKIDDSFKQSVIESFPDTQFHEIQFHEIAFELPATFIDLMNAGLWVFWNHYYIDEYLETSFNEFESEITMCDLMIKDKEAEGDTESQDYIRSVELKEYNQSMIDLTRENAEIRVEFNNLLISIISNQNPDNRPSMTDTLKIVKNYLDQILEKNKDRINQIFDIRKHYEMKFADQFSIPDDSLKTFFEKKQENFTEMGFKNEARRILI